MNLFKRFTALLLAFVLVTGLFPVGTFASEEEIPSLQTTHINPLYADLISEEDLRPAVASPISTYDIPNYVDSIEEAGAILADQMIARAETATVYLYSTTLISTKEALGELGEEILDAAFTHTGVPSEGDYLRWHYDGAGIGCNGNSADDGYGYNYNLTFTPEYHTTADQEAQVDAAVENLLAQLNLSGKSDYEKVKAVYDYICSNVTYDYNSSGTLKHSAYAALIKKTAVCQGYASLLYRLLLELDIDNRFVAGETDDGEDHGWNIIELDNLYYNADSTWDANYDPYQYFLRSMANFPDHNRWADYTSSAFNSAYPMSSTDYVPHEHSYSKTIVDPTCTEQGYTSYLCDCGNTYRDNYVEATDHSWDEGTVVAPTCQEGGYTTFTCSRCGHTKVDAETEAAGHSWDEGTVTKAPTEEETGIRTYKCKNCDETKTEDIDRLPHSHSYRRTVTDPTCTEQGYTTYTCSCGDSYNESYTNALGHDYTETVTPPTCLDRGYTTFTCGRCGDSYVGKETEATGHRWDEGTVTKEPTEEETGIRTYECENCDETKTEDIDVLEHVHHYTETVTPPTCTKEGYSTFTCTCGYSKDTEFVDALGHDYSQTVTPPTCLEGGYTTFSCSRCGHTYVGTETEATGHSWDEGTVTKEPTEGETGIRTYTCKNCDETKAEDIDKVPHSHSYSRIVTAPTCTEQGYTTYTCSCGDSYNESYTSALDHDYAEAITPPTCLEGGYTTFTCSRCDDSYVGAETEATGHQHEAIVTAPTCIEEGYTTFTCHCGDSYIDEKTSATGHVYKETVTAPTCTEQGYTTHTCSNCGDSYTDSHTDIIPHDYASKDTAPTCTEQGYTIYICICGDNYKDNFVAPTGHTWADKVTPPTCTAAGYTTYTCHCGETTIHEGEPALGHTAAVLEAVDPTCSTIGLKEGTYCSVCSEILIEQAEIEKLPHTEVTDAAVAATCTTAGKTEGKHCSVCNEVLVEQTEIAALGHTEVTDAAVVATCTESGLTEGKHCSVCNEVLLAQTVIGAQGHRWGDGVITKDPTETETGLRTYTCSVCNEIKTEELEKLDHTHKYTSIVTTNPTCTEKGYDTYACDTCGYSFTTNTVAALGHTEVADAAIAATCVAAGKTEGKHCSVCDIVLVAQTDIAALGHTEVVDPAVSTTCAAVGKTEGKHCSVCNEVLVAQTEIEKLPHTEVTDAAVAATCSTAGKTEGKHCSVCNEVLVAQNEIIKLPHTEVIDPAVAATCTESGLTEGKHCSVCNEVLLAQTVIGAQGHRWGDGVVTKEPTIQENGIRTYTCATCQVTKIEEIAKLDHTHKYTSSTVAPTCTEKGYTLYTCECGENFTSDRVDALGHTEVTDAAVAATCTTAGKTEGKHCSVCNVVLVVQTEIAALGHTEVVDPAVSTTCAAVGKTEGKHCSVCNEVLVAQTEIEKLPHTEVTDAAVAATCTESGLTEGKHCSVCNEVLLAQTVIGAQGHRWGDGVITKEPTMDASGVRTYTCSVCQETREEVIPALNAVERISGKDRVKTALSVATALKDTMGVEKFDAVVIATGVNEKFADALAGSYLANMKGAPILLYTNTGLSKLNVAFIEENLKADGTVYILGGTGAIPETVEETLAAYNVKRLSGKTRYETNLAILNEAGVSAVDEILVATGANFADSLSASATGLPLLLVNGKNTTLTTAQTEFLQGMVGKKITIIGGTGAVSAEIEAAIEAIVGVEAERISGKTRNNTSVMIAQKYFEDADFALITYSKNFPDGLAGGPLAYAMGAPLLLTNAGSESITNEYITAEGIERGYALGGDAAISDETARLVFGLDAGTVIEKAYYTE